MTTPLPPTPGPAAPTEPLLNVGAITAMATAVLGLVIALGMPVDDDTQTAILAVVAVVAPIVVALVGRGRVFSPRTVNRMVVKARGGPDPTPPTVPLVPPPTY
jgi:hypothetical protein